MTLSKIIIIIEGPPDRAPPETHVRNHTIEVNSWAQIPLKKSWRGVENSTLKISIYGIGNETSGYWGSQRKFV